MTATADNSNTEHQLDLDFRMTIVKGNIKTAMKHGDGKGRSFTAGDLWSVDPRCIKVIPGYNIRVKSKNYYEKLKELEDAIYNNGFKKDSAISIIVIKEDDGGQSLYVKRGHRRLAATLGAIARGKDIDTIPCIIASDTISEEDMTADLFESNNGEGLTPYEQAVGVKRMSLFIPDDHAAIAKRLGLWPAQVSDYLMMINGPVEISNYVRDEVISFTLAVELLQEHGSKALLVIEQGLARSAAAGSRKEKLMPRFVPGKVIKKAITKAAPTMKMAIQEIRQDKGFCQLSPENQQRLEAILEEFRQAEEKEKELDVNPPTEQELTLITTDE